MKNEVQIFQPSAVESAWTPGCTNRCLRFYCRTFQAPIRLLSVLTLCPNCSQSCFALQRLSITYKQWLSEIFLFLFRNLWLFGDRWTQIPACWFKCHFSSDTVIFVEKIVWVILHCQVWAMTLKMITLNFINHLPVMKAVNGDSKSRCFCPNVDDCFALK